MFTKEERLFIWKKVYEEIERLEDGNYICVMLRNIVFKFFSTPKKIESIYGLYLDKLVKTYFPELEEKKKSKRDSWIQTYGTPGFTIVGITRTFQLGNALPRSQDRANIMFNYHLTHKWDQYYH